MQVHHWQLSKDIVAHIIWLTLIRNNELEFATHWCILNASFSLHKITIFNEDTTYKIPAILLVVMYAWK